MGEKTLHLYLFLPIDPAYQEIDDVSAQDFRRLLDINVIGYFLAAKVSDFSHHHEHCRTAELDGTLWITKYSPFST